LDPESFAPSAAIALSRERRIASSFERITSIRWTFDNPLCACLFEPWAETLAALEMTSARTAQVKQIIVSAPRKLTDRTKGKDIENLQKRFKHFRF
jgi:hypothetical protein